MEIVFLGVGEACDVRHPNSSLLLRNLEDGGSVMLDCGFNVPHQYFQVSEDPDEMKALWISHFHGDHFFGVPLMLLRFWEMARNRPLAILGQTGVKEKVLQALELAYPGFSARLQYELKFMELEPGVCLNKEGLIWRAAENEHSQRSLSVRIDAGKKSLFYSGDGRPTEATVALADKCDLVIHEAFRITGETSGHGTVQGSIDFARRAGAANLALVHVERQDRLHRRQQIEELLQGAKELHAFLPEPGDIFRL